ncbi:ras-induced vulval development antagonist-domain-containing protein [Halteromyces radiatus]|uniref:ras-induced vulval development antagonist-domain-containing protein n=1 Tax=Halteromyces radiatus TaxID=101107 RepID=UPI00222014EB|nr:ras-induced vulval development antagonist-domain-containing protein [Halteromyces radiatus]KAI8099273.1 ras-induced vulval development antagonist-domain-containing protein [Halteromyces radiatus]
MSSVEYRQRSLSPYSKRRQFDERSTSRNRNDDHYRKNNYNDHYDNRRDSYRSRHEKETSSDEQYRRHDNNRYGDRQRNREYHDEDKRQRRRYGDGEGRHRDSTSFASIQGGPEKLPGETYMEYRRRVRESSDKTIWMDHPPRKEVTTDASSKKRRSRNDNSDSQSSSNDDSSDDNSDDEDRRRKSRRHKHRSDRRSKKRSKKHHRHSSSRKERSRRRRSPSPISSDSSDSDQENEKVASVSSPPAQQPVLDDHINLDSEDLWVEKQVDLPDDLAPVGPVPLSKDEKEDERAYGSALLPGEGSAMAAYVKEGKRIPRRGEIGLSGDQIAEFENAGYVMSGSRHRRMNAVRLRKENQVISAEEKRLLLQHASDERMKRENDIISEFREILSDKFKKPE